MARRRRVRAETSDQDLLARHVAGDPDAFGELVRRHRDRLWAVALRTLGDREEAADAVQDALVSAYRAAHTFRGQSAVTTWLHRITVNACLDRARKAASRRPHRSTTPSAWSSSWSRTSPPRRPPNARICTASSSTPWHPSAEQRAASSSWTCRATRRGGRPGPRRADRHGEEPLRPRQSQTPAAAHPSAAGRQRWRARHRAAEGTGRRGHPSHPQRDRADAGPSDPAAVKGGGGRA